METYYTVQPDTYRDIDQKIKRCYHVIRVSDGMSIRTFTRAANAKRRAASANRNAASANRSAKTQARKAGK